MDKVNMLITDNQMFYCWRQLSVSSSQVQMTAYVDKNIKRLGTWLTSTWFTIKVGIAASILCLDFCFAIGKEIQFFNTRQNEIFSGEFWLQ